MKEDESKVLRNVGIRLTTYAINGLDALARREDRSVSWLVREAIHAYLQKHK